MKTTTLDSKQFASRCVRAAARRDAFDPGVGITPAPTAIHKIWDDDNYFTARSMDVFITKIRKYIKEDDNVELMNVHGNGYRLVVKDQLQ